MFWAIGNLLIAQDCPGWQELTLKASVRRGPRKHQHAVPCFSPGGGGGSLHALVVNTGNWDVFMRCTTGLEIQKKNSEPVQTFCVSKETQVRRLMVDVLDIDNEK